MPASLKVSPMQPIIDPLESVMHKKLQNMATKELPPRGNRGKKFLQGRDFEYPRFKEGVDSIFSRPSREIEIDGVKKRNFLVSEVPNIRTFKFTEFWLSIYILYGLAIIGSVVTALYITECFPGKFLGQTVACFTWTLLWPIAEWRWRIIKIHYGEHVIEGLGEQAKSAQNGWLQGRYLGIFYNILAHETPLRYFRQIDPLLPEMGVYTLNSREGILAKFRQAGAYVFSNFAACGALEKEQKNRMRVATGLTETAADFRFDQLVSVVNKVLPKLLDRWEETPRRLHTAIKILGAFGIPFGVFSALSYIVAG